MNLLNPKRHTLPPPQRALWPRLIQTPKHFVLYGGTALALRLGHRESVDFDFFSKQRFNPDTLYTAIPYLQHQKVLSVSDNTLHVQVQAGDGTVKMSFFGDLTLTQIDKPDKIQDNQIAVASLRDIFGMKCAVVCVRPELKDYQDIHALITEGRFTLAEGLGAAKAIYGHQYNPLNTLKALTYFKDLSGELSNTQKKGLIQAVQTTTLSQVPVLSSCASIGDGLNHRGSSP